MPSIQDDGKSSCDNQLTSCVLLDHQQQESSTATVPNPIISEGLIQENNTKQQEDDHNSLSITFVKPFENLYQFVEQEYHDTSDQKLESGIFLEQDNLTLKEANSDKELQDNRVNHNYPNASENSKLHDMKESSKSISHGNSGGLIYQKGLSAFKARDRVTCLRTGKNVVEENAERSSNSRNQEHNAKEKVRRMKLNATFLALGAYIAAGFSENKEEKKCTFFYR